MNVCRKWGLHFSLIIFLIALSALLLSCGDRNGETRKPENDSGIPARIVRLSPNVTEIIFALNEGDRLVGVTLFCNYPPEANQKPKMGGVLDTNFEAIIGLKPDVVIDLSSQGSRVAKLEKLGLKTFTVGNETITDVFQAIDSLGELLGRQADAFELKTDLIENIDYIDKKVSGLERPTVAFVADHGPGVLQDVFVAGSGNFINEIIELSGGVNIFEDVGSGYPQVGLEAFLKMDPDFIFDATEKGEDVYAEIDELKAVRKSNIFFCYDHIILVPGPRLPQTLEYFAKCMHPDAFVE